MPFVNYPSVSSHKRSQVTVHLFGMPCCSQMHNIQGTKAGLHAYHNRVGKNAGHRDMDISKCKCCITPNMNKIDLQFKKRLQSFDDKDLLFLHIPANVVFEKTSGNRRNLKNRQD